MSIRTVHFFTEFRYGKAPILIATDVASRGLGQYVIQYHLLIISVILTLKKVFCFL